MKNKLTIFKRYTNVGEKRSTCIRKHELEMFSLSHFLVDREEIVYDHIANIILYKIS